jgi:hypothetical protein
VFTRDFLDGSDKPSKKSIAGQSGLPRRYVSLAWKAYDLDIISVAKLAELLRENVFDLRARLEHTAARLTLAPLGPALRQRLY